MTQATSSNGRLGDAAALLVNFVHGSLMLVGVGALALGGSAWLQGESVSYGEIDAVVAQEQVVAEAPSPAVVPAPVPKPAAQQAHKPGPSKLSAEMQRVRDYVVQNYKVTQRSLEPLLAAAETSGRKLGIDPLLIVAVMAIESSFNPFAESSMGAQGLMQVIPRFHEDKIGKGAHEDALFDPMLNIRVGTQVIVEGIRRFGSLQAGLQYYAGALRDPNASYANKVLALKQRLGNAAGRGQPADGA